MTSFTTCFTTTLFFPISIDPFQLSYNPWKYYIQILTFHAYTSPHISHSTFHVTGCTEHRRAQVKIQDWIYNSSLINLDKIWFNFIQKIMFVLHMFSSKKSKLMWHKIKNKKTLVYIFSRVNLCVFFLVYCVL
jgi:hypothetical protein